MNRILVSILLVASSCLAQEAIDNNPLNGMIRVSFGRIPQTNFITNSGAYESRWSGINAVIPVHRAMNASNEGFSFQQYSLTGTLRRNTTELSLFTEQRVITTGRIGISWIYIGESKNLYLINSSLGIAEDKLLGDSPEMRFTLTTLGLYRLSDPFRLIYGGNYSSLFGRDLLLPILGMQWQIHDEWSSTVILPFSLAIRYKPNSSVALKLGISAAGERARIANQGTVVLSSNDLQLQMTGVKIAVRCTVKLSEDFGMDAEFGSIARRSIKLMSGSSTLFSTDINTARYFSVGIRYSFSVDENIPSEVE